MLENFGTLGLFIIVAFIVPIALIGLPLFLGTIGVAPKKPNPVKKETYECGMKPFREAWTQFNFHYYTFAILFVALDIMSVFLFPWAVNFASLSRSAQVYGLIAVGIFVLILVVGFVYAWKKKALEWK